MQKHLSTINLGWQMTECGLVVKMQCSLLQSRHLYVVRNADTTLKKGRRNARGKEAIKSKTKECRIKLNK
jgi:hypothetical protein